MHAEGPIQACIKQFLPNIF
jgi:hypothetical protein